MIDSTPRQSLHLLLIGLASLRQRLLRAITTVAGTIGVVAVLVSLLSIAEGYDRVVNTTAAGDTVRVLNAAATAEIASNIPADEVALIRNHPMLARSPAGVPLISAELFTSTRAPGRNGKELTLSVRGIEPAGQGLAGASLRAGRAPQSGRRELMIGTQAAARLANGRIGSLITVGNSPWRIVGIFAAGGGLAESEIWADAGALAANLDRGGAVQTLHLKLRQGTSVASFARALDNDPRLHVRAIDQRAYLAEQSGALRSFMEVLGYGISGLMALGAAFAALGTSYASVNSRIRELGTYRALGFRNAAVFWSIVGESLLLTITGGVIGAIGAWLIFDGLETSTVLFSTNYTQTAFAFAVSPAILVQAAGLAIMIGLLGSLYPSLRVLRLSIAEACGERR